MANHLPSYRKFEGYLFKDTIIIRTGLYRNYHRGSGMYDDDIAAQNTMTLHCYQQKHSMSTIYQTIGTEFENTITIVIRHNQAVYDKLFGSVNFMHQNDTSKSAIAQFKGIDYKIINISADDSHYGSYDYLTLKAIDGVKSNG